MSKPPAKPAVPTDDPTAGMSDHEAEMWRRNNPPKVAPAALPTPGSAGSFLRDPVTGALMPDPADAPPSETTPTTTPAQKEAD